MLQVRGGALFIVLQGWFREWRRLQAGKVVVLNFHAMGELQRMTGGAGRPPLGRPAWGLRHLAPTFSGWLGFSPGVGLHCVASTHEVVGRLASLWPILALCCTGVSLHDWDLSREVDH